jgi:WD40 repeat protein
VPVRVFPIFRDREELPVSADLGMNIVDALRRSRYLIVICSPSAARSRWVNEEIKIFKALGGESRILALIVEGEPNASDGKPGFAPDAECFPEALRYQWEAGIATATRAEPIAADARPHGDGKANARLKLLAGLLGVDYDALRQRDQARRVRRLRAMVGAASILIALFALLGIALYFQRDAAREQENIARQNAKEARDEKHRAEHALEETRRTLSQSDYLQACRLLSEENLSLAIAYLCRSLRTNPRNASASTALLALLTYNNHPTLIWSRTNAAVPRVVRAEATRFAVGLADGSVSLFSLPQGSPIGARLSAPDQAERDSIWKDFGINDVAFSPDGKRLATADQDNRVRMWDLLEGKMLFQQEHATLSAKYVPSIYSVRFDPSGKLLATAATDGCGLILDVVRGELPQAWQERLAGDFMGPNGSVEFAPDGSMIAAATKRGLSVWQAETAKPLMEYVADVRQATFSHDGARVIAACGDGTARVFDPKSGKSTVEPLRHFSPVVNARFAPGDGRILCTCEDGSAWLWDAATGEHSSGRLGHTHPISAAEFSDSGRLVLTASADGTARLWDALHTDATFLPMPHSVPLTCAAFAGRNSLVLTTSTDARIRLWEIGCNSMLPVLLSHRSGLITASVSPDATLVMTVTEDQQVAIWDSTTGQRRRTISLPAAARAVAFSADGHRVRVVQEDGEFAEWATSGQDEERKSRRLSGNVRAAIFSADRKSFMAASEEGTFARYDADTGGSLRTYSSIGPVTSLAISSDNTQAALTFDGEADAVRIDLNTGKKLSALPRGEKASFFAFSQDGRLLAGVVGNEILVWDTETGQLKTRLAGSARFARVCFAPDGATLFTTQEVVDNVGNGQLWDVATGQPHRALFRHRAPISHVEFFSDGTRFLTTSKDGFARLWSYLPMKEECPPFVMQLATVLSGYELNDKGMLDSVPEPSLQTFAEIAKLIDISPESDFAAWGRWFVQERGQRPVGPHAKFTLGNYFDVLLDAGTGADLEDAAMAALGIEALEKRLRER